MQNPAGLEKFTDGAAGASPRLLLITGSRRWTDAVRAAAADIGGIRVAVCPAREAVIRLAGAAEQYSHVLLQPGSADGWLAELLDLTAAAGSSSTEMFLLAPPEPPPPRVGVIRSASRRSVRKALSPSTAPPAPEEPDIQPGELHDALVSAMIDTRYQPIVRISDRKPVALEALARLNHPTRGTVLPDNFIPQIEDAGLAAQLTDLVGSRAFTDMKGPVGALGLLLTLNFPLDVLLVPEALARLDTRRQEAGIAADRIAIELTESRPVDDIAALGRAVEQVRNRGYRVSIDDIGPAVPRVRELLELPFTSVKLDKQVVQQSHQPDAKHFAEAAVQAARQRGMTVIAEGVEDVATWQRVQALGADCAQGFLVARPLSAAAVPIWFEAWVNRSALSSGSGEADPSAG